MRMTTTTMVKVVHSILRGVEMGGKIDRKVLVEREVDEEWESRLVGWKVGGMEGWWDGRLVG